MEATRFTPIFLWGSSESRILRTLGAHYQFQSVTINGYPIGLMNFKGQMLLVRGGIHHNRSARLCKSLYPSPHSLSNACRNTTYKYPRSNLEEPSRKISP